MRLPVGSALLLLSVFPGCEHETSPPDAGAAAAARATTAAARSAPIDPRVAMILETDARRLGEHLRQGLRAPDVESRRAAALGVARLHDPDALPVLREALRDPDVEVRRRASLGLGALEADAPPEVEQVLVSALAAEPAGPGRAALLEDLGRVGGDLALPAFRQALAGGGADLRAAACRALASYGLRTRALDTSMIRRVSARMIDDERPSVRRACAYALSRLSPPEPGSADALAVASDLSRAAQDVDPRVRAMAVRSLGHYPDVELALVSRRTSDGDWQVSVQAFRSLGRLATRQGVAGAQVYASALRRRLVWLARRPLQGPELQVLLQALDVPPRLAATEPLHRVALEALQALAHPAAGQPLDRDRGLAHCAAARLVDLGRHWPTRLADCGLDQVSRPLRQAAMARLLAAVEGADPQRLSLLRRLSRPPADASVRIAVVEALPSVHDPGVLPLLLGALRGDDAGVLAAACDALGTLAARLRAEEDPGRPSPVLSVRPAGTPRPHPAPGPARRPDTGVGDPALRDGLRAAHRTLSARDHLEGLQSWLGAVAALRVADLGPEVAALATHHNPAVRAAARRCARSLGVPLSSAAPDPVPNVIEPAALLPPGARPVAVLQTDRGEVEIELLADEAPTTVARFVSLLRSGFYDGLTFHRVVPAFVVQGGDPEATGYGGPGWSQRCEDNRVRYERGTVGMALAGRDTGGSQFFITLGPQPHLDGRYTAFGRVTGGMAAVDALQVGDRISRATLRGP